MKREWLKKHFQLNGTSSHWIWPNGNKQSESIWSSLEGYSGSSSLCPTMQLLTWFGWESLWVRVGWDYCSIHFAVYSLPWSRTKWITFSKRCWATVTLGPVIYMVESLAHLHRIRSDGKVLQCWCSVFLEPWAHHLSFFWTGDRTDYWTMKTVLCVLQWRLVTWWSASDPFLALTHDILFSILSLHCNSQYRNIPSTVHYTHIRTFCFCYILFDLCHVSGCKEVCRLELIRRRQEAFEKYPSVHVLSGFLHLGSTLWTLHTPLFKTSWSNLQSLPNWWSTAFHQGLIAHSWLKCNKTAMVHGHGPWFIVIAKMQCEVWSEDV